MSRTHLEDEKKRLSRLIGERKRAGAAFEDLLAAMRAVSDQLRDIAQQSTTPATVGTNQPEKGHEIAQDARVNTLKPFSITQIDDNWAERWDRYVDGHAHASIYHYYTFRDVIEHVLRQRCIYLAAVDVEGSIVGVLPATHIDSRLFGNYMVSLPYFNYGGALGDDDRVEAALIDELIAVAGAAGARHLELRDARARTGFPARTDKVAMLLDLPVTEEQLWQQIGSKVRAQIKQSRQHDLHCVVGGDDLLDDFYRVFARNMRDLGTPVYDRSLFRALLTDSALKATLAIVYHGRTPVSCAFLLGHRDTLEIPWASTLRSANPMSANMFLYWEVLRFAVCSGYRRFDFGRSSRDAGTFRFKKQWHAEPRQLYWHYWMRDNAPLPQMNPHNPKFRLLIAMWRRLPVFLTRWIGPGIVRQLP